MSKYYNSIDVFFKIVLMLRVECPNRFLSLLCICNKFGVLLFMEVMPGHSRYFYIPIQGLTNWRVVNQ